MRSTGRCHLKKRKKNCCVPGIGAESALRRIITISVTSTSRPRREIRERSLPWMFLFTQCRHWIGSFFLEMNGADALVFTAGIGGKTAPSCARQFGANLDQLGHWAGPCQESGCQRQRKPKISAANSEVKVLVIPTNEELVVARESKTLPRKSSRPGRTTRMTAEPKNHPTFNHQLKTFYHLSTINHQLNYGSSSNWSYRNTRFWSLSSRALTRCSKLPTSNWLVP